MESAVTGVFHNVFKLKTSDKTKREMLTESKILTDSKSLTGHELLCEIEMVKQGLNLVTSRFEFQDDPDLVESCIYEMQALTARYRYLLREARRIGLKNSAISYEQAI